MAHNVFDSFVISVFMLPIRLEILVLSNMVLLFLFVILNGTGIHIDGTVCRYIRDVEP